MARKKALKRVSSNEKFDKQICIFYCSICNVDSLIWIREKTTFIDIFSQRRYHLCKLRRVYLTFADYSGDGNLSIRSITTAHKSGATTIDGVKPGMSEDFSMRVWAIILLITIFLQLKYLLQYTYHLNRNRLLSSLGAWLFTSLLNRHYYQE